MTINKYVFHVGYETAPNSVFKHNIQDKIICPDITSILRFDPNLSLYRPSLKL